MQNKRHIKNRVLIVLGTICALLSFIISYYNKTTTKELAANAEIKLQQKETIAQKKLDVLTHFLKTTKPENLFSIHKPVVDELYKNDLLIFKNTTAS